MMHASKVMAAYKRRKTLDEIYREAGSAARDIFHRRSMVAEADAEVLLDQALEATKALGTANRLSPVRATRVKQITAVVQRL